MRPDLLDRPSEGEGPLHRLDPRLKLVATLAFIILVVATPLGSWRLLAAEGLVLAFALGLSGVPPLDLGKRWLGFLLLIGFLATMVAISHPRRDAIGTVEIALTVVAKNSLAFVASLLLAGVTPFRKLLEGLGRLGVPPVVVAAMHFMYRYLYVFNDELDRMVKARRSRTFRRSGRLDWGLLSGLIGVLFLRSIERGERVHAAMLARGWTGTFPTLDGADRR